MIQGFRNGNTWVSVTHSVEKLIEAIVPRQQLSEVERIFALRPVRLLTQQRPCSLMSSIRRCTQTLYRNCPFGVDLLGEKTSGVGNRVVARVSGCPSSVTADKHSLLTSNALWSSKAIWSIAGIPGNVCDRNICIQ